MAAVAEGDRCAFETLVLRYQQTAWNVAYRFLRDRHQAEDVVQDAFLRVYEARGRYRPDVPFTAYLRKIVVRRCIDHSRKRRPFLFGLFETHPADDSSPDKILSRRERLHDIRDAVERLPDRQRMAVVLRYLEGLDARETAHALETTPKAVERLLARARKTLERGLEERRGA
jgi:RNA polymerase sigma-70 factor, ECF subfamily